MAIKKHDFIEIEYTGRLKNDDSLFDTTDETIAKEEGFFQEDNEYGPIIVCVGENHVLDGIENNLEGKEVGDYSFEFGPEEAFGKKDGKLIQLMPTSKFVKQGIRPQPGLQVEIDDTIGVIRTVTGGRTLVDFNHPLSGKDVKYDVKVKRIVTDRQEQADAYLKMTLRIKDKKIKFTDNSATITTKFELPAQLHEKLSEKLKEIFKVTDVKFEVEKEKKQEEKKDEPKDQTTKKQESSEKV